MTLFWLVLLAFGTWGLADAVLIYPARGRADAEYRKYQYLLEAAKARKLNNPADVANPNRPLTIDNPAARLAELQEREGLATSARTDDQMARAELAWLDALSKVAWPGGIDAKLTEIPDGTTELTRLQAVWEKSAAPVPLARWDLPLQWLFMVLGYGGALWMGLRVGPALRKVYKWDPATLTLHLPDGQTLVPADVREFDKRRWDKLYIDLHLENNRPSLPLDLQVYIPLEEWVLEMERARFPESAEAEGKAEPAAGSSAPAPTDAAPTA